MAKKEKSKLIIHNYTDLEDAEVLQLIQKVVQQGKVSHKGDIEQYSFATTFTISSKKIIVESDVCKNKKTFKFAIYEDKNGKFSFE